MVGQSLEAAAVLAEKGIDAEVIDLFSIKPIDADLILTLAAKTGAVVTAEEHSIIGGLGGAVSEVLVTGNAKVPVEFVGLKDTHAECGKYAELLCKYGLDVNSIVSGVEAVLKK